MTTSANFNAIKRTILGHVTLPAHTYTQRYECAAWCTVYTIPGGNYPIVAETQYGSTRKFVEATGSVLSETLRSRIGAHYGADPGINAVGRIDTVCLPVPS